MRFWFDTEFYEDGKTIELISIGIVSEGGRELYAETEKAHQIACSSEWLISNVLPHLQSKYRLDRTELARNISEFVGHKPEFWAYYADYDWVVLCQIYGTMMDLPKDWPMYCNDIKQMANELGNPPLPKQFNIEHHALWDARWAKRAHYDLTAKRIGLMLRPYE